MNINNQKPIAVLGAGSWGTALAIHLARNKQKIYLWGRDAAQIEAMQKQRCNKRYLPENLFPENLHTEKNLSTVLTNCTDVLIAIPSHAFRATLQSLKNYLPKRLILATKGIAPETHQLLHEVVAEILGDIPTAILAGPSFAKEVAKGLPTAITIASKSPDFIQDLIAYFHSKTFRVYSSTDIIGVEISGAMKNVLAIAVGIADGMGFGANARSALITRGLAEMVRLGTILGGKPETFMGLAGMGDLVLTCTDNQSRNRRFGIALGQGKSVAEAKQEIGQVIEGLQTVIEIQHLSQSKQVELPICEQVFKVLTTGLSVKTAVDNILTREPKTE